MNITRWPFMAGMLAMLSYFIFIGGCWDDSSRTQSTTPGALAPPPVAPAIKAQETAVDYYYLGADGKPLTTHAAVQSQLTANRSLATQYEAALKALVIADGKLDKRDQQITENDWSFYIYMAAGIVAAGVVVYFVVLAVTEGVMSLLSFGLLEKIGWGGALLASALFTIGKYIHYLMYIPYMIAIAVVMGAAFIFVTHHSANFLVTLKSIFAKGTVDAQHLLNPIVAAIHKKANKLNPVASIVGSPAGST